MSRRPSVMWKSRRSSAYIDIPAGFMTGNKIVKKIMANRERLSFDTANLPKTERDILHKVLQTRASLRASAENDFLLNRIREFPLFCHFSAEDIAGIIEGSSLRKCESHTVLCAESASAALGHVFILLSGKVSTTSQSQTGLWKSVKSKAMYSAAENALDMVDLNQDMFFIAGDAFGEECILQDCMGIYERTAITSTECLLMEVLSQNALNILQVHLKLRVQFRTQFFYTLINPDRILDSKRLKIELFSHTRDWPLMKKLTREAGLKLLSMVDIVEVMAHKQVFMQGDKNDYVYIVFQGQVDIFLNRSSGKRLTVNEIRSVNPDGPQTVEEKKIYGEQIASMQCGQIFGDFYDDASNNTRSASAICRNEECTLLRISKDLYIDNFIMVASMTYSSQNWMPVLSRSPAERTENDIQLLMHMAASVPLFQRFPKIERENILRKMSHEHVRVRRYGEKSDDLLPSYAVIIEEGPIVGDNPEMYWILQGNLQVRSLKNQTKSAPFSPFAIMDQSQLEMALDASFGTLDFIVREGRMVGERILHTDSHSRNRTASVIAVGSVILGVINKNNCQQLLPMQNDNCINSECRNAILTKLPIDRTADEIECLSKLCLQSQVLQHLPKHVADSILREAHGVQFNANEVVYIQNSKAHFFAILLEGSITSHAFRDVDPVRRMREEDLFANTAQTRRILKSIIPSISDVRMTRDFGPCNSVHFAGSSFGRHLLLNPRIGDEETTRTSRQSTLITLEPSFFLVFQTTRVAFNLSPSILDVFCPNLVINALGIEPSLRNNDAIDTILTLLNEHFGTSPKHKLIHMAKSLTMTTHRRNEIVFYQGDVADKAYVVVSGIYGVFIPRAKLTNREASALAHMIKTKDWEDNIEVKKVHQFSGCSVFGETAMYSNSARDAIRNASVVAIEDSVVVAISKEDYLDAVMGTRNFVLMKSAIKLRSMHSEMNVGSVNDLFNILNAGQFVENTLQEFTLYDVGQRASSVYILIEGRVHFFKKGGTYSVSDKDSAEILKQIQYATHKATATGPFSWMGHPECDVCRRLQGGKVREKIDLGLMNLDQIPICRACRIQLNSTAWMEPADGTLKQYAADRHHFLTCEHFSLFGLDYIEGSNVHKFKVSAFGRDTRILKVDRAAVEALVGESWAQLKHKLNANLEIAELDRLEIQKSVVNAAADEHLETIKDLLPMWVSCPSVEGLFNSLAKTGSSGPVMHSDQWLFFCHSNGFLPKLGISEQECLSAFEMANAMEGFADCDTNELSLTEFCYCMILMAIRVGFLVEEENELLSPLNCSTKMVDAVVALLDVMTNGQVKRGQRFKASDCVKFDDSMVIFCASRMILTLIQAPKASGDMYRLNLGKIRQESGNANMPVCSKSEVAAVIEKIDQSRNPLTPKIKSSEMTGRKATSKSPKSLWATSVLSQSTSPAQVRKLLLEPKEPSSLGISGFNFKSNPDTVGAIITKIGKDEEIQNRRDESQQSCGTPVVLKRSASMPSPVDSNAEVLPDLHRSSSTGNNGAAIRAALGSGLFASFRKTTLANVLEKVKAAVGEHMDSSPDEKNFEMTKSDRFVADELSFTKQITSPGCAQPSADEIVEIESKDRANIETERQSNHRNSPTKPISCELELADATPSWNRFQETESTSRKIQKNWKFDAIAEVTARPYSGLKKNASAARRPGSAIGVKTDAETFGYKTLESNPSATPRSIKESSETILGENTRTIEKLRQENKMKEISPMGPGGFWRSGLHSASREAIQRKLPNFVANIAEVKKQTLTCSVCQSWRSKDARGVCKNCGA